MKHLILLVILSLVLMVTACSGNDTEQAVTTTEQTEPSVITETTTSPPKTTSGRTESSAPTEEPTEKTEEPPELPETTAETTATVTTTATTTVATTQPPPPTATNPNDIAVTSVLFPTHEASLKLGVSNISQTAVILPYNASVKTVTWKSSNTNVATIDGSGYISANAVGTTTITATSNNGLTASYTLIIYDPNAPFDPQPYVDYAIWYGESIGLRCGQKYVGDGGDNPIENASWDAPLSLFGGLSKEIMESSIRGRCEQIKRENHKSFFPYAEKQENGTYKLYIFYA